MNHKGLFITLEGADGSGKTSVTKEIVKRLKNIGYDVVHTREPGGIEISESIREVILNIKNSKMDKKTEALLYAASRRQHLIEKVIPALNENKIVICERFLDSSLAYQGYARGIGIDEVLSINNFAIENFMPELTIFLDVSLENANKRMSKRVKKDRLDLEEKDFHLKVIEGYKIVNEMFKDRIVIVNANNSFNYVVEKSLKIILDKINE